MSDEDPIRFRVTATGEYEGTPGSDAYDGETDPFRMAAIDASNDWVAMLETLAESGDLTMTVEPIAAPSPVREGGDDGRAFVAQCRGCDVITGIAMERDATGYDEQDWHEMNAAFMTRAAENGRRLLSLPEREWRPRLGSCRCPGEESTDAVA